MVELVFIGASNEFDRHRQALSANAHIGLIDFRSLGDALEPEHGDGWVIGQIDHKADWIEIALKAGKPVMATHPIARLDREPVFPSDVPLCIASACLHTETAMALNAGPLGLKPTWFFEIAMDFNSEQFPIRRESAQAQMALHAADLLLGAWGPVDELYCRTRNFFHAGPVEDVAVASLKMRNGLEGLLKLVDHVRLDPQFRLRTYGDGGVCQGDWLTEFSPADLVKYYANYIDCIQGVADPLYGWDQARSSYGLLRWMRASARADAVQNARVAN